MRSLAAILGVACAGADGCTSSTASSQGTEPPAHGHGADPHGHGSDGHSGPLVHRFESADQWAKIFDDPARDAWQKPADVVDAMKISEGMVAADVGAGTGYFEPALSRAVGPKGRVLAVDIEPDMVRYLGDRAKKEKLENVEAVLSTPGDPSLPPGKVDRVLIVDTWHHVPDRSAFAEKLAAALTARGTITIVDFTMESEHGPPKHHRLKPEQIIAELQSGGLQAAVVPTSLTEQFIVVAQRPPR